MQRRRLRGEEEEVSYVSLHCDSRCTIHCSIVTIDTVDTSCTACMKMLPTHLCEQGTRSFQRVVFGLWASLCFELLFYLLPHDHLTTTGRYAMDLVETTPAVCFYYCRSSMQQLPIELLFVLSRLEGVLPCAAPNDPKSAPPVSPVGRTTQVFPLPRGTKDGKAVRGVGWGGGHGEKGHPLEVCTPSRFYIVPPPCAIREKGSSAAAAGAGGAPVVLVGFGSVGETVLFL